MKKIQRQVPSYILLILMFASMAIAFAARWYYMDTEIVLSASVPLSSGIDSVIPVLLAGGAALVVPVVLSLVLGGRKSSSAK